MSSNLHELLFPRLKNFDSFPRIFTGSPFYKRTIIPIHILTLELALSHRADLSARHMRVSMTDAMTRGLINKIGGRIIRQFVRRITTSRSIPSLLAWCSSILSHTHSHLLTAKSGGGTVLWSHDRIIIFTLLWHEGWPVVCRLKMAHF